MNLKASAVLLPILFICLSILSTKTAFAQAQSNIVTRINGRTDKQWISRSFTPHLTIDARTRRPGKVSFQRAPGANINTGVLLSSVTVAVAPRIELGSMPVFYALKEHRYNYNVKWNFWKGDLIDWSFGYSQFSSEVRIEDDVESKALKFDNSASQIAFNLHPKWTRFIFSASYSGALTRITGDKLIELYTTRQISDFACDLSYPVSRRLDVTVGAGSLRETGFSAYEDRKFGFGASTGVYFPNGFISKVALGTHYVPSIGQFQTLLGLSFL